MNRRQCLWGLLFLAVTVVVVVAVWQRAQLQQADRRYTDLESCAGPGGEERLGAIRTATATGPIPAPAGRTHAGEHTRRGFGRPDSGQ